MVLAMAALPWLVRRWQQRSQAARGVVGVHGQILGSLALGPGQRVVTVELNQGGQKACLVLGVTAHNIQCLHVLSSASTDAGTFAQALGAQQQPAGLPAAAQQQEPQS